MLCNPQTIPNSKIGWEVHVDISIVLVVMVIISKNNSYLIVISLCLPHYVGDILFLPLSVCPSVCLSVTNCVCSITSQCLMGFGWNLVQMFTSSTRSAEPNFWPCHLKVKVICRGQMSGEGNISFCIKNFRLVFICECVVL